MLTCRELDRDNPDDIEALERAQYDAFAGSNIQTLDAIWTFDHDKHRLRATIPYAAQRIAIINHGDTLIGAMSVNCDLNKPLQLETIGFTINKNEDNIAEGLGIFCNEVFVDGVPTLFELRKFTNPFLRSIGIHKVYGTCSEYRLKGYTLLGFKDIGMTTFQGETKYLLVIDIPE